MTLLYSFDPATTILQPSMEPASAKTRPLRFGVNQTITKGQSIGVKTADKLAYAFATGAGDGTQLWMGFSKFSFKTDANGLAYFTTISAVGDPFIGAEQTMPIYMNGIFNPFDVTTAAAPTTNVVTFTPTTVTTGDVNRVTYNRPNGTSIAATFTVGGTATAAAVVTGLTAAWNAIPELTNLAVASGSTTFILTAVVPGWDINSLLVGSVTGTGTLPKANTTPAAGRAIADIQTSRPGTVAIAGGHWMIPGP
jgi:hypothetical protein